MESLVSCRSVFLPEDVESLWNFFLFFFWCSKSLPFSAYEASNEKLLFNKFSWMDLFPRDDAEKDAHLIGFSTFKSLSTLHLNYSLKFFFKCGLMASASSADLFAIKLTVIYAIEEQFSMSLLDC